MTNEPAHIASIREALEASPDNASLRRYLGELLLDDERYEEAETEFRRVMKQSPSDGRTQLGLARAFHGQGKNELARVVLEEYIPQLPSVPSEAYILHARILLATGKPKEAVDAYRKGVGLDPKVADAELAKALGVTATDLTSAVVEGRVRQPYGEGGEDADDGEDDKSFLETPSFGFSSVGGMDRVKEEIRMKIILPLTNKDLYAAYGKKVGGGILMYGPPGCGKTHLARATAGETKSRFLSIGLHDVLDMWIGQSEQKLHQFFERARQNSPCVLFFDEVDALAASRTDMRRSAGRHLINQFLSELDGIDASNEGVLVLAATNAPWHLDSAFRRPGRFDRILFVPPPDLAARSAILEILLSGKPCEGVDFDAVARKTDGLSGADLKAVVDVAVEIALREAMKAGKAIPLSDKMLLQAAKGISPSTREWFATARNHALFANEGGLYDEVIRYLKLK